MLFSKITVFCETTRVRFVSEHEAIEITPAIYLDHGSPPNVLSVGVPPADATASRAVHLFDGRDYDEDKVLALEAFFRFGFRKLLRGGLAFPPKVSFEIAPDIVAQLGGYHRIVFHYCAKMAGAYSTPYEKKYGKI